MKLSEVETTDWDDQDDQDLEDESRDDMDRWNFDLAKRHGFDQPWHYIGSKLVETPSKKIVEEQEYCGQIRSFIKPTKSGVLYMTVLIDIDNNRVVQHNIVLIPKTPKPSYL